ncbi:hypothetical protein AGMMS4957_02430 [Bacteroidia bacterium]|nr:hypothetical protein AGMMS4957_02430 [Bacteroidia bacterium]
MKTMNTVFKLTEIHPDMRSDIQYPVFEVSRPWELEIFSSLKSAEAAISKREILWKYWSMTMWSWE